MQLIFSFHFGFYRNVEKRLTFDHIIIFMNAGIVYKCIEIHFPTKRHPSFILDHPGQWTKFRQPGKAWIAIAGW